MVNRELSALNITNQGCFLLNHSLGQTFMADFLASLAIFSVITGVFLFSWNGVVSNQVESGAESMRTEARYTTTFLVSTSGYPENWNSSNVEVPGFASSDNFLQENKISRFSRLSYERQKRLFKAENFYLEFSRNGTPIEGYSFGIKPENASIVTPVNREILLNTSGGVKDAEMRYIVWK